MKHNIKTTEIFLTPAISEYFEKRISHLDKFMSPQSEQEAMCYAEIGKSTNHHKKGDIFIAELNVHIGGKNFRVKSEKDDLYAAIDAVSEEMAEELKSFKGKNESLVRKTGARIKDFVKKFYE